MLTVTNRELEILINKLEKVPLELYSSAFYSKSINFLISILKEKSIKKILTIKINKLINMYKAFELSIKTSIEINKCYTFLK
jgi:hypothetical protein